MSNNIAKCSLHCGDCFDNFRNIKEHIDLVVVDLPYGQIDCKWDKLIDLDKMWDELKKICKKDCVYVFFCTTKFGYTIINSNPTWFRYDLVWRKQNIVGFLNSKKQPLRKHEMLYIFKNPKVKGMCYNPQKTVGKPYISKERKINAEIYSKKRSYTITNTGDRYPISILSYNNGAASKKSYHPTGKPVDLLEWLIKTYSNENDNVLDFTMGGGSCGVAALKNNRNFYGIEKNKDYYDIAVDRIGLEMFSVE